jgi:uroporphyrinogen-III decarboxylase
MVSTNMDDRFMGAYEKIKDVYQHTETNELPVVISDVNYWLSDDSPEDYFDNYHSMVDYQERKIDIHMSEFKDDYVPLLFPWFGTGVIPSAIGCKVVFNKGQEPALKGTVINEPKDIKKLSMPDPYKDGLMPKVLNCIDYMREKSKFPVSFTDPQGPLNIALSLCGIENLFIWMFEYPTYVHELMEFCSEVFIQWVKVQKKHAGQQLENGAFPLGIMMPEGSGGVWISDDDCTILSPELYKEFVVPYNSKIFKAFGGGSLHFCGTAEHQLENFLNTEGLTGINNFCMSNFRQIHKMQEMFENRIALMVCDFTPLYIESYYRELINILKFKGTILSTYVSPAFALVDGKYETLARDRNELMNKSFETITRLVREKKQGQTNVILQSIV